MSRFQPEIIHQQLGAAFYDKVEAASFPDAILRYRNQAAADKVGLGGLMMKAGLLILLISGRLKVAFLSLLLCAITVISLAHITLKLAMGAGFYLRKCVRQERAVC